MSHLKKKTLQETQIQQGRSMVEMLGVLAVIGVLSVGGFVGMQYAMQIYKENETLNALSVAVAGAKTAALMESYIYSCSSLPCVVSPKTIISTNYEMRKDDFTTAVGSPVLVRIEDENGYTVRIRGINKELCESIKSGNWGEFCAGVDSSGLSGFSASDCKSLSSIECSESFKNAESGFGRQSQLQADIANNIKVPNVSYSQAGYNALVLYFNDKLLAESSGTESGNPSGGTNPSGGGTNPDGTNPGGTTPGGSTDPDGTTDDDEDPYDDGFYDDADVREQVNKCKNAGNVAVDFRLRNLVDATKSQLAQLLPGMNLSKSFVCCNGETNETVFVVGKSSTLADSQSNLLVQEGTKDLCKNIHSVFASAGLITQKEEEWWSSWASGSCVSSHHSANCCNWGHGGCSSHAPGEQPPERNCDSSQTNCERDCHEKWVNNSCCSWYGGDYDMACCNAHHYRWIGDKCCKSADESEQCCNMYGRAWADGKCCKSANASQTCCEATDGTWANGKCCSSADESQACCEANNGTWADDKCCESADDSQECCEAIHSNGWWGGTECCTKASQSEACCSSKEGENKPYTWKNGGCYLCQPKSSGFCQ